MMVRKPWSKQEDQKLIEYIKAHGEVGCWRSIPQATGLLRCGKSCRRRWLNHLRPRVLDFAEDEEDLIIKLHALLGNRWSLIAGRLPGRTDNEVKNYWNSYLKGKLISMGIDPNNHRVSHNLLLRKPDLLTAESGKSSGKPGNYPKHKESQGSVSPVDDDSMSDTASSMGDKTRLLPDLNLDLTISVPSPRAPMEQRIQ